MLKKKFQPNRSSRLAGYTNVLFYYKDKITLMCIKVKWAREKCCWVLPHHVNSWIIPVDLGSYSGNMLIFPKKTSTNWSNEPKWTKKKQNERNERNIRNEWNERNSTTGTTQRIWMIWTKGTRKEQTEWTASMNCINELHQWTESMDYINELHQWTASLHQYTSMKCINELHRWNASMKCINELQQ